MVEFKLYIKSILSLNILQQDEFRSLFREVWLHLYTRLSLFSMKIIGMDAILERCVYYFPSLFFQKEGPILPRFIEIYTVLVVVIAVYFK